MKILFANFLSKYTENETNAQYTVILDCNIRTTEHPN